MLFAALACLSLLIYRQGGSLKYGYLPDKQRQATETVIQQAEMMAGEFRF